MSLTRATRYQLYVQRTYGIINEALKVAFFLLQEMIFKMTFHKQNDQ